MYKYRLVVTGSHSNYGGSAAGLAFNEEHEVEAKGFIIRDGAYVFHTDETALALNYSNIKNEYIACCYPVAFTIIKEITEV